MVHGIVQGLLLLCKRDRQQCLCVQQSAMALGRRLVDNLLDVKMQFSNCGSWTDHAGASVHVFPVAHVNP